MKMYEKNNDFCDMTADECPEQVFQSEEEYKIYTKHNITITALDVAFCSSMVVLTTYLAKTFNAPWMAIFYLIPALVYLFA